MTKQFTIPCQFGQQTSPVTFYIGHPDNGHHPIHFQSNWLSSSKGGTVPQDLMMTLQKLHDLALENNADFEELCYYALISATQNSGGDGVSEGEITSYADEYLKKEMNGEVANDGQSNELIGQTGDNSNSANGAIVDDENADNHQVATTNNKSVFDETNASIETKQQDNSVEEKHNDNQQTSIDNGIANKAVNGDNANKTKVMPSLNTENKNTDTTNNSDINGAMDEDLLDTDLFEDNEISESGTQQSITAQMHSGGANDVSKDVPSTDDDLLLDDDIFLNNDTDGIEQQDTVSGGNFHTGEQKQDILQDDFDDLLDDEIMFDDNDLTDDEEETCNDKENEDVEKTTNSDSDLSLDDDLMDFGN